MKTKKIIFSIAIACFILTGCKNEVKKEKLSLSISGMTCEIGCAKTIQSKLSKVEGVLDAKVVFKDSIANIEFDANTTSKKDLIAFVDGIAGGELYKASENSKEKAKCDTKKDCKPNCEKKCDTKKECKKDCKKECCTAKEKTSCKADCKKACCATKNKDAAKKACKPDCKKECCVVKTK